MIATKTPKLKILFVDDEPMILEALSQLFDTIYEVHTVCCGKEAIEYVRQNLDIAIVVSDQRMPGLKGIDVLKAIKEVSPDTIRILLTGFADADAILDSVNVGEVFRYVKKPWNPADLINIMSLASLTFSNRKRAKESKANSQQVIATATEPINLASNATPALSEPSAISTVPLSKSETNSLGHNAVKEILKQRTNEERFIERLQKNSSENVELAFRSRQGKPKILIVDDEQGVLTALSQLLSDEYEVLTASSADEAMALLNQDSFMTLLLTDQRMPKKTGTDLLIESREVAPLVPKVLITAYTDVEDIIRLINEGQIYRYIQKPWNPEKLKEIISEAIELYLFQLKSKVGEEAQSTVSLTETVQTEGNQPSAKTTLQTLAALSQLAKRKSETESA